MACPDVTCLPPSGPAGGRTWSNPAGQSAASSPHPEFVWSEENKRKVEEMMHRQIQEITLCVIMKWFIALLNQQFANFPLLFFTKTHFSVRTVPLRRHFFKIILSFTSCLTLCVSFSGIQKQWKHTFEKLSKEAGSKKQKQSRSPTNDLQTILITLKCQVSSCRCLMIKMLLC